MRFIKILRNVSKNIQREHRSFDPNDWFPSTPHLRDFDLINGFTAAIISMIVTAFLGLFCILILSYPNGLEGLIANVLIETCKTTGECRIEILYPAFGLAIITLTIFCAYFIYAVFAIPFGSQYISLDEIYEILWGLSERLHYWKTETTKTDKTEGQDDLQPPL
jgi:hypothetical protein